MSETSYPQSWVDTMTPFAAAIGKSVDEITTALANIVGPPSETALSVLSDEDCSPLAELQQAIPGVPVGLLRKAVAEHLRKPKAAPTAQPMMLNATSVLPKLPAEESFLSTFQVDGALRANAPTVIMAIRAALANTLNFTDVPDRIIERHKQFTKSDGRPADGALLRKVRQVTSRTKHADIFEALGIEGTVANARDKQQFLADMNGSFWPALLSFFDQLKSWQELFDRQRGADIGKALSAVLQGSRASLTMPPTDAVRDAALSAINSFNTVFGGVGVISAISLGGDAKAIRDLLEMDDLPAKLGYPGRDQMLKDLGIVATPSQVRQENAVAQFALAVLEYAKQTLSSEEERQYLEELYMLGQQISWSDLGAPAPRPRGRQSDEMGVPYTQGSRRG